MGLLDELKKNIDATEDLAKLKTAYSLLGKRISALEASMGEAPEETAEEAPAEEGVEEPAEMEEVSPEEEAVEEPAAPVKKPAMVAKPKPKPQAKPKIAAGMMVYGPPTEVKVAVGAIKGREDEYPALRKGDQIAFSAKVEKIEGDRAIINYTDLQRSKALGGNPPKRVRVAVAALEPVAQDEASEPEPSEDDIPEE